MTRALLLAAVLLSVAAPAAASNVVKTFTYTKAEFAFESADLLSLAYVREPPIVKKRYAFVGMVRYENVKGKAYFSMDSLFGQPGRSMGEKRYFTMTMAEGGPMGYMEGTSSWRRFVVPFDARAVEGPWPAPPKQLSLSLVTKGAGTFYIGQVQLVQYDDDEDPLAVEGGFWWSDQAVGLIGGALGCLFGLLGAFVGIFGGRGKLKTAVLGAMVSSVVLGFVLGALGITALLAKQPYAVYCPFLLGGFLAAVIFGALLPVVRRRYHEIELRRMQAADIG